MPVKIDQDYSPPRLLLSGVITIEETDELLEAFSCHPDAVLDLADCTHLHTAPLQLLKLRQTAVVVPPADSFWLRCLGINQPFRSVEQSVVQDSDEFTNTEAKLAEQTATDSEQDDENWGLFE